MKITTEDREPRNVNTGAKYNMYPNQVISLYYNLYYILYRIGYDDLFIHQIW